MPTPEQLAARFREVAGQWAELRATHADEYDSYQYTQLEHWFYALAYATGFDRTPGESLDRYLARARKPDATHHSA